MKKWPPTTRSWQKWAGSVGGVGFLPLAPGTWGAAAGVLVLLPFLGCTGGQMLPGLLAATAAATLVGVPLVAGGGVARRPRRARGWGSLSMRPPTTS